MTKVTPPARRSHAASAQYIARESSCDLAASFTHHHTPHHVKTTSDPRRRDRPDGQPDAARAARVARQLCRHDADAPRRARHGVPGLELREPRRARPRRGEPRRGQGGRVHLVPGDDARAGGRHQGAGEDRPGPEREARGRGQGRRRRDGEQAYPFIPVFSPALFPIPCAAFLCLDAAQWEF